MNLFRPSSSEEADHFISEWCNHCTKNNGCEIIGSSFWMMTVDHGYPRELCYGSDNVPQCTAFKEKIT